MDSKFNLPLDLNNNTSLKTFLISLDDFKSFKSLSKEKAKLPTTASEILSMLNDPIFKKTSKDLVIKYVQVKDGKYPVEKLKGEGKEFHTFLTTKYPVGYKRLQECANEIISTELKSFETDVATDIAIAVEAVVAATVWVNVAAVTQVAVAAAAVVVVGVFVI